MKTAFIIRMHFKKDDPRWPWRFAYFRSIVLPLLLNQRDDDFDICIRVNKHHAKEVQALSDRIKIFDAKPSKQGYIKPGYEQKVKNGYFVDFLDYEDLVGLEKYEIQIGIDTDDLILRDDLIIRCQYEFCSNPDKTQHISFQPHIFHTPTMSFYECPIKYGVQRGSPIYALYQPLDSEHYIYAYEDSHLKLPQMVERASRIEEGFCAYSVHGYNTSTEMYRNLRKIKI